MTKQYTLYTGKAVFCNQRKGSKIKRVILKLSVVDKLCSSTCIILTNPILTNVQLLSKYFTKIDSLSLGRQVNTLCDWSDGRGEQCTLEHGVFPRQEQSKRKIIRVNGFHAENPFSEQVRRVPRSHNFHSNKNLWQLDD
ncbi:hypothetical protein WN51_06700 [Melipona quadrifasciata]|uniref:Uncharacterized protein n=1 Tax=Melipona quadrifasciata TaxID=166423 RepID=A0A0N0BKD5_9HYME|nr:hypothetical protein WN51_06700 [Melipona quadrifasciata]